MIKVITIRQEVAADHSAVYALNCAAFGQDNEAKLVNALRKNNAAFIPELSLVAMSDDKVVGYILFTRIKIVDYHGTEHESLALAPIAVGPEFQKNGIGGLLISQGLLKAQEAGFRSVIVLGHEHYYPRFGFVPTTVWHIKAPFEVPANAFMGIELVKGGLDHISGTVRYPKEFEEV
jgi:predicted N-acetyltransferase YhbS